MKILKEIDIDNDLLEFMLKLQSIRNSIIGRYHAAYPDKDSIIKDKIKFNTLLKTKEMDVKP